nr:choice-of-anchor D domain-containing protein [Calditrichia bacterium]
GTTTGEFTPRSGFTPYNLMPGQSRELVVSFSPRTVGVKTATIRIVNNDADENPYDVPLAGEGTLPGGTPDVAANPSFLNYGDVRIDSSALRTTTISNVGTADLVVVASNILGASRSSFTITAGGGGYTLSPGQTRDVTIALNPAEVGRLNASLALNTNDPDELTFLVPLNGTITPIPVPDIAATPASVDFGTILLDSSAVRTVTLSNVGTADLNITAVNLSGAAAFSLESGGDPVTLAPGASTDLTVRFLPLAEGPVSGSLEVLSDDPDEASLLVPLAGTGMARPEADIQVSATALAFGDVLIGESAPALLFVSNVGQMTLTVSATVIEGSHAAEFGITGGGAPFALAAGESREVALSFTPVAAGAREAVLRIDSDDPDENPLMVALAGSGVIPPNTAPEIDAIADQVLAEGASLVLPVLARDADGDAIVLAAENLPTFGSFTDNGDGSGSFSFAPGFSDSGVYPAIRVIATDNAFVPASDTVEFQLTVTELNRAPVLAAIADQQVNEGETLVIPISASDPDGNQLRFSAPALPDFVQLNDLGNGHGELHIAPRYQDSGAYPSLAVMVSDNGNPVLSDTARFDLTVIDVPDVVNPECAVTDMDPGPPFVIHVAVRDTTSGLSHIEIITATNVQVDIPSFDQGYTDSLSITGTKIDQSRTSVLTIRVFDMDGNSSTCDPVFTKLAAGIPESFNLGQNYPNPFNPTTTIEFGVAQGPLPVSLRLYDITGKQVRVLVDEVMEAGSYQVEWDGRNDLGEKVASGVYIYQMKVQGFVQTRKLMMLK